MEAGPKVSVDLGVTTDLQMPEISGIPKEVVKRCILRELIRPEERNGQQIISSRDVLILKVVYSLIQGFRIQAKLKTICQKSEIQTNFDVPLAALMGNTELYASIAIELANEKSL